MNEQPQYIIVGVETEFGTMYRIERTSDRAQAGWDPSWFTEDGVRVNREPQPREWLHADMAAACLAYIELGALLGAADYPVVWIPHQPFFTTPDARHED